MRRSGERRLIRTHTVATEDQLDELVVDARLQWANDAGGIAHEEFLIAEVDRALLGAVDVRAGELSVVDQVIGNP